MYRRGIVFFGNCGIMSDRSDDLRQFMIVVRQALLLIVSWIERHYNLKRSKINASASDGPGENEHQ